MWLALLQRAGLDTEKLLLCQPDSGEMALEVVDQTVRSSAVDIICVDSVAALVPRSEIEGEMGAHQGRMLHGLHSCMCSVQTLLSLHGSSQTLAVSSAFCCVFLGSYHRTVSASDSVTPRRVLLSEVVVHICSRRHQCSE